MMKATRKLVLLGAVALATSTVLAAGSQETFTEICVPVDNLGGVGGIDEIQYVVHDYTYRKEKFHEVTSVDPMQIEVLPTKSGCTFGGYFTEPDGKGFEVYGKNGEMSLVDVDQLELCRGIYDGGWAGDEFILYAYWQSKCVITFDFDGGTSNVDRVEVMLGEQLPLIKTPIKEGHAFVGYSDEERGYYDHLGRGLFAWDRATTSLTVKASWATVAPGQGASLQEQINSAPDGEPVEIEQTLPVVDLTTPLVIPEGKNIHLKLCGFWIGRAAMDWSPVHSGEVIRVLGKLTLDNGTVFGGSTSGNGGGVLVGRKGVFRLINNSGVCANKATCAGGGIYGEKYSALFIGSGITVKDNSATVGADVEIPCGTVRFCNDADREQEESDTLRSYSQGLMLIVK